LLAAKSAIVNVDGLVLARNVGYDDWVRRADAIEAMTTPPIKPMRRVSMRYAGNCRRSVDLK
jgi:hypothetical protein